MKIRDRARWGLPVIVLALAAGKAQAESCLVLTRALDGIQTSAAKEPANPTHSVLRPCKGQVRQGRAPVIYGIGDGVSREVAVGSGEYIEQRISASLGPDKKLADIWPKSTVLAALRGLLAGEKRSVIGASGFDGPNKGFILTGSIIIVDELSVPLAIYGLDAGQPLSLVQGSQRVSATPQNGTAALPMKGFKPGPASIEQGGKRQAVRLVALSEEPDLQAGLARLDSEPGDPDTVSLRRSLSFQEADYPVNAVAEYMKKGGTQ